MRVRIYLLSMLLCVAWAGVAFAAEAKQESDVYTLGTIVVSDASKVRDIALHSVVTSEEIENIGATTAAEALRYVPGVNIATTSKGEQSIVIQGFQQRDVLVLLDGVPYYETKYSYLDLNQIPASIISEIEVIKGASSVLYGPNAMGGVVNIITKKGVEGIHGSVRAEGGGYGYNREVATFNAGSDKVSALIIGDRRARDGFPVAHGYSSDKVYTRKGLDEGLTTEGGGTRNNSSLRSWNGWGRIGYTPTDDTELYVSAFILDLDRDRPPSTNGYKVSTRGNYSTFGKIKDYRTYGMDASGKHVVNNWLTTRALFFWHLHQDKYESYKSADFNDSMGESTYRDTSVGGALFGDMELAEWNDLSIALHAKSDTHKDRSTEDSEFDNSRSNTLSIALEDTTTVGPFTFVVGVLGSRFYVSKIDGEIQDTNNESLTFDPMAGITYDFTDGTSLFASAAKKTRFPTLSELADAEDSKLSEQRNINYTLGVRRTFFDSLDISLAGFYNDIDDLIFDEGKGTPNRNVGSAETWGIEFDSSYQINERLSVGFDYTYTYARDLTSQTDSTKLPDTPEHIFDGSLNYMIPVVETAFDIHAFYLLNNYVSTSDNGNNNLPGSPDVREDDSFNMSLSLRKEFDNGLEIFGYVNNLFDNFYYEGLGQPNQGTTFKAGMQYTF